MLQIRDGNKTLKKTGRFEGAGDTLLMKGLEGVSDAALGMMGELKRKLREKESKTILKMDKIEDGKKGVDEKGDEREKPSFRAGLKAARRISMKKAPTTTTEEQKPVDFGPRVKGRRMTSSSKQKENQVVAAGKESELGKALKSRKEKENIPRSTSVTNQAKSLKSPSKSNQMPRVALKSVKARQPLGEVNTNIAPVSPASSNLPRLKRISISSNIPVPKFDSTPAKATSTTPWGSRLRGKAPTTATSTAKQHSSKRDEKLHLELLALKSRGGKSEGTGIPLHVTGIMERYKRRKAEGEAAVVDAV